MSSDRHFLAEYLIGFRTLAKWLSEPLLLLSLWLPMAGALGAAEKVGLPSLIWHDRLLDQFLAGAALLVLAVNLGVTGFFLECRGRQASATFGEVARYASRPALLMFLALLLGIRARYKYCGAPVLGGFLLTAALGGAVLLGLKNRSLTWPRARLEALAARLQRAVDRVRLPWDPHFEVDHRLHILQASSLTLMFVLYLIAQYGKLPAIVAVALCLVVVNGVAGALKFWLGRYGTGVVLSLLLAILVLTGARDAPPPGVTKVTLSREKAKGLLDDQQVLEHWLEHARGQAAVAGGPQPPLVVVATSGGGIRAAVWSVVVLQGMEGWVGGFHEHLRIVTGASGGMVGAAHYVSALPPKEPRSVTDKQLLDAVSSDSLSPVARALLSVFDDRGRALESAWEESNARLKVPFSSLSAGENAGWRPSLVFTPTIVEDGRRLVISNLELSGLLAQAALQVERSLCRPDSACFTSVSGVQLFAGEGDAYQHLKLSTAARMSATFPWVTSAMELPSEPPRRIVDAGYYDNYGVDLAVQWLRSHEAWFRDHHVPVALIQIRDGQEYPKRTRIDQDEAGTVARWLSPLGAPVEAFLSTWTATMNYRNDAVLGLLADDFSAGSADGCAFTTAVLELSEPAPLNWYLDPGTRKVIERSMPRPEDTRPDEQLSDAQRRNRGMLRALQAWWKRCSAPRG